MEISRQLSLLSDLKKLHAIAMNEQRAQNTDLGDLSTASSNASLILNDVLAERGESKLHA
ncbi:hypothetical protein [Rhizobium chutanense]|uniref:hypothetical protein n=1 Tax=Rhizobium chutanense TaxID=2035448 RepID=UPI000F875AE1|nr:hypothetical protein [Rhizobium chutanense]